MILTTVAMVGFCCAAAHMVRPACADERGKKDETGKSGITFEAVLEAVDGNTVTARAQQHVIPPSGSIGGTVYSGHLPVGAKAARYERLPVMPEAGLRDKALRPGMRVSL